MWEPKYYMISSTIRKQILERLSAAEADHAIQVLYACESGSRAWGFASPDSDYDVRFIYVHDAEWYLSFDVEHRRDVVEYPIVDDIDCCGWDFRKALYLFTRSNGALLEWLHSPIIYIERGTAAKSLRDLAPRSMNSVALCYHYSHMARGNAREYLFNDKVRLKKYLYVLRPLLAIRYIEQGGGIPPVQFERLVEASAPSSIRDRIATLLRLKRDTSELGIGDPIPEISEFIESELERHGTLFSGQGRPEVLEGEEIRSALNVIFRKAVGDGISGFV
jgi:uncharacterized protein